MPNVKEGADWLVVTPAQTSIQVMLTRRVLSYAYLRSKYRLSKPTLRHMAHLVARRERMLSERREGGSTLAGGP